jgi:hypothetical protein
MGLRVVYESGISGQTEEIQADRLRLYGFDVTEHAEEGSVALSAITIDDPDGDLDVVGWRRIWAYEDTATGSNSLIYHAWVGDKRVTRGTYLTQAGRTWTITVADQNTTLGFRVLTIASANRPAETDVARVQWLQAAAETFGRAPITEIEFLFSASAVLMDAADYRGQTPLDVLNDCAQQSGKNYFVYTKDNGYPASQPTRGLWYGSSAHTGYTSILRLSNVAADVDNVWTFAIGDDTELVRDPARVYSGAYVQYQGGAIYEQVASTYNQFTQRDAVVSAPNVKTSGAATRRATRYLADLATEEDRITTSFYVPAAKVNFVKPGMRIQFKASHLPQYESGFNYLRVLSRGVAEVSEIEQGSDPKYKVTLVLSSDTIPATPIVTAAIQTDLQATLTIGSATFLGLPADRERHNASDLGLTLPTLVIGRQYRLVATVIDCLSTPLHEFDHINSPSCRLWIGSGGALQVTQTNGYNWTPDDGTQTDMLSYQGDGYNVRSPVAQGGTAPNGSYRGGQIITGEWLTFDGPALTVDMAISGQPLSGFYGFLWTVQLELQSRAP